MKKTSKKLLLNRETLQQLGVGNTHMAGANQQPAETEGRNCSVSCSTCIWTFADCATYYNCGGGTL